VAAAVAREATKKFIREIKNDVTQRQLKLLLGVGPSLAMAIDTTGSMGSIIDGVKQQAIAIVDARLGTDEEPSQYVLAPFNDPGVGPVQVTTDPDAFKAGISGLSADGGDDCPELSNSGMLQAVSSANEGGSLFMFTDASSKDGGLAGAVSSLATSKDIKVFPITFGSCSPLDPA
jgi:von Willebrand factor A domain-containing protein 7